MSASRRTWTASGSTGFRTLPQSLHGHTLRPNGRRIRTPLVTGVFDGIEHEDVVHVHVHVHRHGRAPAVEEVPYGTAVKDLRNYDPRCRYYIFVPDRPLLRLHATQKMLDDRVDLVAREVG